MASPASSNASRTLETGGAATGTPGSSPASNNRPAVDLTAITTRDDFLLELGEALGGQASVRPVDSIGSALEHLTSTKRGQVLVIDTRDVGDVRSDVERAHSQAPHAVVLVFAHAEAEKQIGAAVKGSNVFAVLPIPIDKRKTSVVLEGAMGDAVAKRASARSAPNAGVTVESFQPRPDASADTGEAGSKSKTAVWAGAGLVVVALATGAFWFFTKDNNKGSPATQTAAAPKAASPSSAAANNTTPENASLESRPVVETSIVQGKIDELLEKARLAMRERRYSEPTGDNALLYYRSAVAADASNGEALDGLQRVAAVLASRFDEAMTAGHFDEAAAALASFKSAAPKDSRIAALELRLTTAQVSKAFADGNTDRAAALVRQAQQSAAIPPDQLIKWRSEISRRQEDAKLQRLANLVSERIRDGKLAEPADDSAKTYVQQLHDTAPSNPATQRAVRDLNSAYMRKAREAALAKNNAEADRWLADARAGGVSANEVAVFQREVAISRQKAAAAEADHLAQLARERVRDGRLTDPAQDSAAYYIGQLQAMDATNASLSQVSHDLAVKLLDRARAAARDGKSAQVDADLTQAKRWGADSRDVQAVQQVLSTRAAAPARSGSGASAAAAAGVNPASLASSLKRQRYVPPEFPTKALSQHLSGSVTVEYIVDAKGDPRDVRVIEATPPGVFDRAATTAVKRWHYEPVLVNGAPVEVPVRTSIRFELPK